MDGDLAALYSGIGRPSIAPQMLLRAMLLQAFYSVRSERQLMPHGVRPPVSLVRWSRCGRAGVGSFHLPKNRDRLLEGAVAARFMSTLLAQPRVKRLLSTDHFSVDADPGVGVDEERQAHRGQRRAAAAAGRRPQ